MINLETEIDIFSKSAGLHDKGGVKVFTFFTREGLGAGIAQIPVQFLGHFIALLENWYENADLDDHYEVSQDNHFEFEVTKGVKVASYFNIMHSPHTSDDVRIRTCLGKGNKPLYMEVKNIPQILTLLRTCQRRIEAWAK